MKKFILCFLLYVTILFPQVKFDADFESGNLNTVSTSDSVYYVVTTNEDIGGRWFYFRISGVKDKHIKVRVSNSDVTRAMYSYDDETYTRFSQLESPAINTFEKVFEQDTVYVAYYTPYDFTYLQKRINEWNEQQFVSVDTLGYTDRGFPMQEIRITDPGTPDENKYRVWIHARTHPGETPSSFQFDGIVQKLLSNDDVIDFYRKNIIFHLIPFTNPEGVYYGRSRTNYDYVDVERSWNDPPDETITEVKILKQRMEEINSQKVFSVFLNLHSQAAPYCTFWIHTPGSTSQLYYRKEYQFANINTSDNPYFAPSDYSESNLQPYFPEGMLWSKYDDQVMALTYETPYDQYSDDTWVTNENLYYLGARTVYSIAEYLELSHPKHLIVDNINARINGDWETYQTGLEFYGNDYYVIPPGNGTNSIVFESGELPHGFYDVYAWWQSNQSSSYNSRFTIRYDDEERIIEKTQRTNGGQWNYLTQVELNSSDEISVELSENPNGYVVADAIRLIYQGPATSVKDENIPGDFKLYQNYPNPFNPSTVIKFNLKKRSHVQLRIFNPLGETIAVLVNRELGAGEHQFIFDTRKYPGLSSGVYYYMLSTEKSSQTKGMVLTR